MSDETPKVLGRYEIQQELGRGMMGVVYEARDPDLGRLVALKTIKLAFALPTVDKTAFEKRFMAEARAAAGLSHPGIVVVHDVGRDPATGTVFIALEHLEGNTLAELSSPDAPMDWRQALRIAEKLAEALHHAHQKGIVHRDIKPANIMLVASSGQPKIMDFGIAKLPASTLTTAGEFFGTPSFMSPEQAGGQPALDGRSDLFSLGCVLYQLVTTRRAFDGETLPAILMKVMKDEPVMPSAALPGLPAALDAVVRKSLAKDKADRYQTGQQMAEDIRDVLANRPPRHAGGLAPGPAPARTPDTADVDVPTTRPTAGGATGRLSNILSAAAGTSVLREGPRQGLRRSTKLLLAAASAAAFLLFGGALVYLFVPRGGQPAPITLPAVVTPRVIASGQMEIALQHSLESGFIKVWIADDPVLERPIEGRVVKKVLNFRQYKGSFNETVSIPPGDHFIRVQVTGEGFSGSKRIRGAFASGLTRQLRANVTAWPKRELELSWGS